MLGKFFVTIRAEAMYSSSAELFLTIRGEAMGFLNIFSRKGSAGSTFISKALSETQKSATYLQDHQGHSLKRIDSDPRSRYQS